MNFRRITAAFLAAVIMAAGTVFAAGNVENTAELQYSGEYQAFEQIAKYVAERYIDDSYTKEEIMAQGLSKLMENNDPLLIALLKTTLESMDDYSEFYTAEEYKEFQNMINRTFYGIGVTMHQTGTDYVEITGFASGNDNAEKAGFKVGDKIYKVNGTDVTGWKLQDVREEIIGEEGTAVKITVLREDKAIELVATRVAISETTVSGGILEGDIGYIQIVSFNSETAEDFEETLNMMREKNVKKVILDLRNNGGGVVSAATRIAQMIVPKGKIIDVKYRQSEYNETYTSNLEKKEFDFVVLVNEHTASASEILASAIQDSGAGKLVGTTTFGKAVIQNTFPLTNGSAFKLTVGQYITRNGNEINHKGLTPDTYVENVTSKIDTSKYTQFDYSKRSALGMNDDNVKAAKERLSVLGYYDGTIDSSMFGEELKSAVKAFQQANDIFSYGVLDIPTQERIEEIFSDIDVTSDEQLKTAYEMFGGDI
ncbi:MAG: S41 family peptidase, partial [Hominilimicola sp.]